MTSGATAQLVVGTNVAGRFRVTVALASDRARPAYLAEDRERGEGVRLLALAPAELVALRPLVGLTHAHLNRVSAVVEAAPGGALLVVEQVRGSTLEEVLRKITRETPLEAIRSTLRVADALTAIHQAGGCHGGLRPAAVIVAPEGHPPPQLTFAPTLLDPSPYRSPGRGPDDPPSPADDVWALAAICFETLVGQPPPAAGLIGDDALVAAGLRGEELRAALLAALAPDPAQRATELSALRRALARWFVDVANDESPADRRSSRPPPLPTPIPTATSGSRPPTTGAPGAVVGAPSAASAGDGRSRWARALPLAGLAFVVAILAVWASAALRTRAVEVVEVSSSAGVLAAPSPSAPASIRLGDVPVTGDEEAGAGSGIATCVAGYLPPGAFGRTPKVEWLCEESNPVEGALRLRSAVVAARPPAQTTEAMRLLSRIDWYELALYAAIRSGCCVEAPPLALPVPAAGCSPLDEPLARVADDVGAGRDVEASLRDFTAAARCEARAGRTARYRQKGPPTGAGEAVLREFLRTLEGP